MRHFQRREFLKTTAFVLSATIAGSYFDFKKQKPLLSFSTLGCPDWTFTEILNFANQNKYDGIEIRGIRRELDLGKCPEFSNEKISGTIQLIREKKLKIVDLGSSAELHHTNEAERQKNMDEAKRFIELAEKLDCPFVRVFPNQLPNSDEREKVITLIIKNLIELGDFALGTKVSVLMETHGDAVKTTELKNIMETTSHPKVGLVWDIVNMWSVTKEPPSQVYPQLKKYIRHTHIKDLKTIDGKEQYVLLGQGEAPIFEAIDLLYNDGYKGFYSFEWEKLWHPEIAAPEIAIADYPKTIRKYFERK
jgi:sugar phosphate isomerase/epimerase